jgi:hypothetical protein
MKVPAAFILIAIASAARGPDHATGAVALGVGDGGRDGEDQLRLRWCRRPGRTKRAGGSGGHLAGHSRRRRGKRDNPRQPLTDKHSFNKRSFDKVADANVAAEGAHSGQCRRVTAGLQCLPRLSHRRHNSRDARTIWAPVTFSPQCLASPRQDAMSIACERSSLELASQLKQLSARMQPAKVR